MTEKIREILEKLYERGFVIKDIEKLTPYEIKNDEVCQALSEILKVIENQPQATEEEVENVILQGTTNPNGSVKRIAQALLKTFEIRERMVEK